MTDPLNDLHSPKSLNTRREAGRGAGATSIFTADLFKTVYAAANVGVGISGRTSPVGHRAKDLYHCYIIYKNA